MNRYITSKDNDQIKNIKKLEEKKYRTKTNLFVIEGIKVVDEAIDSMLNNIEFIVYNREILNAVNNGKEILEKLDSNDTLNKIEVTEEILKYLTDTVTPQGIIAVVKKNEKEVLDYISSVKDEKFLIIDRVQDAGNLGSIIRSCNAFNVRNIICIKGTVDPYMNKVVRSTMGGILKTNIFEVDEKQILNLIKLLKEKEYSIVTTALYNSENFTSMIKCGKINKKTIFVVGNEANGVSKEFQENSDLKVRIPMEETAESLNVGVATSIVLYEQYVNE